MPLVWHRIPEAELWLVGSEPPASLLGLQDTDQRVHVTGYVEQIQDLLSTMSLILCPWTGTYGFRSRLVEVMALGVPVIASPDAVYGMDMRDGAGIFLRDSDSDMAEVGLELLEHPAYAKAQSRLARQQVEQKYSFEATYGRLAQELLEFCRQWKSC